MHILTILTGQKGFICYYPPIIMKWMVLLTEDRPGIMARISYILVKAGINIEGLNAFTAGGRGIIYLLTNQPEKAKKLLEKNGFRVEEEETIIIKVEDKPGMLSKITERLAKEKINIISISIVGKEKGYAFISLKVDRTRKAKNLLKDYLIMQ